MSGKRGCSERRTGGGHPFAQLERERPVPHAEAAAVHPAPPDPEVLAKPPRASEPDTLPEPVQEGGDPLLPK